MINLFDICLLTGFAIPILSLLTGALTGAFGFILDVSFDLNTDHNFDGLVPFNLMSICFALIIFGSLGKLFTPYMTSILFTIIIITLLILISFMAYLMLYKFVIVKLKRNNPSAIMSNEIIGTIGKLILRVTKDSDGVISVLDSTGATISYRARISDSYKSKCEKIDQGTEVVITGFNKNENICYVVPMCYIY